MVEVFSWYKSGASLLFEGLHCAYSFPGWLQSVLPPASMKRGSDIFCRLGQASLAGSLSLLDVHVSFFNFYHFWSWHSTWVEGLCFDCKVQMPFGQSLHFLCGKLRCGYQELKQKKSRIKKDRGNRRPFKEALLPFYARWAFQKLFIM